MSSTDGESPKSVLDKFLRDDQKAFLSPDHPCPTLPDSHANFALNETPHPSVLSLTQRGLARIIDTNLSLSRTQISGLKLYAEKVGTTRRFYLILSLRGQGVTMWLRLATEPRPKRSPVTRASSKSVNWTARLSPLENELTRKEDLLQEHQWPSAAAPLALHNLQHALCIIYNSVKSKVALLNDGSLFSMLLLKHWGIYASVESLFASSKHMAKKSEISDQVIGRFRDLSSISLPASVYTLYEFKQTPTLEQFLEGEQYDDNNIHSLTRYRAKRPARHEFIIVHSVDKENHDRWFRLDRAAYLSGSLQLSTATFSSDVTALDTIVIVVRKRDLFTDKEHATRGVALAAFSGEPDSRPTVRALRMLLQTMCEKAPEYNVVKENCRFVACVIQNAFEEQFHARLVGDGATWAKKRSPSVAETIIWDWKRHLQTYVSMSNTEIAQ